MGLEDSTLITETNLHTTVFKKCFASSLPLNYCCATFPSEKTRVKMVCLLTLNGKTAQKEQMEMHTLALIHLYFTIQW